MKKILTIAIIILTSMIAQAQYTYTPNTYYLIPPTNGCNGVWALKDTIACQTISIANLSSCSQGLCAQVDHSNGDTLFFKLCCIPCQITGTSGNGNICMQATCGLAAGINEFNTTKELEISWQDHYTFTLKNTQDTFDRVLIISITGQVIKEWTKLNRNENITFNTNNLANGLYVINTFKNGGMVSVKKLIKD